MGFGSYSGIHQISAGVWFQRLRDNEDTASRQLGQASFTSLTTFLQGNGEQISGDPVADRTGMAKSARRMVPRGHHQAAAASDAAGRESGTSSPTGWNEESGRAANYVTGRERRAADGSYRGSFRLHPKQARRLFGPRRRAGVGCVRQRPDGVARRLRHILLADRRSQLSC